MTLKLNILSIINIQNMKYILAQILAVALCTPYKEIYQRCTLFAVLEIQHQIDFDYVKESQWWISS